MLQVERTTLLKFDKMSRNILYYMFIASLVLKCKSFYFAATEMTVYKENESKNCTKMKFYCDSCTELVMCIDTDYGFMKQRLTCSPGTSCLVDKCTPLDNPLCDGTADIPFKCHVAGVFPDPFDCRTYHFCVPQSDQIVDDVLDLKHYAHKCPNDGDREFKYDPRTTYCKYEIEKGCSNWPVPLCKFEGETGALEENTSIFYVCDMIDGHLYPHMYVCPHGGQYNAMKAECDCGAEQVYNHMKLKCENVPNNNRYPPMY